MPKRVKEAFLILSAALLGYLSVLPGSADKWVGLWAVIPLLWHEAPSRRTGFLAPLFFYLAVSRGIVPGAYIFFQDGSLARALLLWGSSAVALSFPWGVLWSPPDAPKAVKIPKTILALLVSIPPPLGIICWTHPLMSAGFFFPRFGWWGFALAAALCAAAAHKKINRSLVFLLLATLLCRDFQAEDEAFGDLDVREADTSFGRLASGSEDFDLQFEREKQVFRYIRELYKNGKLSGAEAVILPETLIGRMNPVTRKRWERFLSRWTEDGTVFLIGAEIPRGMKYDNVVCAFGKGGAYQEAKQRFPVPFSMYRGPRAETGANAYMDSFGGVSVLWVKGKRFGVLVCYEQFLAWPFLTLLSQKPDAIAAVANMWWARDTSLPSVQRRTVRALTSLFGLRLFTATNL